MRNLCLLLGGLIVLSCNQQPKNAKEEGFVIEGEVTNFPEGTLLYLTDPDTQSNIDSTTVTNSGFQFKGKVEEPKQLYVNTKLEGNQDTYKFTSFWVANGVIKLKGDYDDFTFAKAEGLPLHDIANALADLKKPYSVKMDRLSKRYNDDDENNKLVSSEMKKMMRINDSITINFIKKNPNNLVSLSNISFLTDKFSKEELNRVYNALDQYLKETTAGKSLRQYIDINKILEKGDQLVNLQGENLQGESKNLATIVKQHKYTVLDFWAAGCGPCRMQSKQYRELYKTYKEEGLEIVSFSLDQKREHWKKASEEDSISWVNISDLKGMKGMTPMTYGIRGIPNSFLINQEGKIVAEFTGFNPNNPPFQNKLATFFSEEIK